MYEKGFYHETYYTQAKIIVEIYTIEQLFFILRIIFRMLRDFDPTRQANHS